MSLKRVDRLPEKLNLVGNMASSTVELDSSLEEKRKTVNPYEESSVPEELEILLKDHKELIEMHRDITNVEQQISGRLLLLKEEIRYFLEHFLDVPVRLEGDFVVYETTSREKSYKNRKAEAEIQSGNEEFMHYYTKRTLYQLDLGEPELSALLRFINAKNSPTHDQIMDILKQYRQAKKTSYGYRTSYLTCVDEKKEKNKETLVYVGTIFDNTQYSNRVTELIFKTLSKIKMDYVNKTGSTYPASEYILKRVGEKWLIIHKGTGATDVLDEEAIKLCSAISQVQFCLDENGLLANNSQTDFQIDMLQNVLGEYIAKRKEAVETSYVQMSA